MTGKEENVMTEQTAVYAGWPKAMSAKRVFAE
jgi:alkylhydroperoxidase/carboxymuconolactone decarboxylase family protein YurZ